MPDNIIAGPAAPEPDPDPRDAEIARLSADRDQLASRVEAHKENNKQVAGVYEV
jgi:hypothetical protein